MAQGNVQRKSPAMDAKTPDDVRKVITEMWSRAGRVPKLVESWRFVLPILCENQRWQLNRDLALLALASYSSPTKGKDEGESPSAES